MTWTEMVRRMVDVVANRVQNIVQRAVLSRVDDSTRTQSVQVKTAGGVVRSRVEHFQPYGFTSVPLEGAEAVLLSLNGSGDHGIVIVAGDRRYRLTGLAAGEVALYTDEGDKIHIKRGGTIEVTGATEVRVSAPKVTLGDDSDAMALASKVATELNAIRTAYDLHIHTDPTSGVTGVPTVVFGGPAGGTGSATVKAKD